MTDSLDYTQREELAVMLIAALGQGGLTSSLLTRVLDVALEWHIRQLQELREAVAKFDQTDVFGSNTITIAKLREAVLAAARRLVDTTEDRETF